MFGGVTVLFFSSGNGLFDDLAACGGETDAGGGFAVDVVANAIRNDCALLVMQLG